MSSHRPDSVKTPNSDEPRTAKLQMRIRPSVKAAGEKAAADDNRSLSSLVETLLIAHLRDRGYLPDD